MKKEHTCILQMCEGMHSSRSGYQKSLDFLYQSGLPDNTLLMDQVIGR